LRDTPAWQGVGVKLLVQSAMIFFGTLMAAGLVALGEPGASRVQASASPQPATRHALNRVVDFARPWVDIAYGQRTR
jgi:hypothetical protein